MILISITHYLHIQTQFVSKRKIHNSDLFTAYPASSYLCWYEYMNIFIYGSIVADLLLNRMIHFNNFVVFNSGLPGIKALLNHYLWHLDMMKLFITTSQFFHAFISTYRLLLKRVLSLSRALKDVQSVFLQSTLTHRAICFPIWLQMQLSYQECSNEIHLAAAATKIHFHLTGMPPTILKISHKKSHPVFFCKLFSRCCNEWPSDIKSDVDT